MHRAAKRAELLSNTDRKKILEILKLIGLFKVPMVKLNGKIIDALRKFQDPAGVKTAKVKKKGIQEMTFQSKSLLDEFNRVWQENSELDYMDDPVFQILCEGHLPDVAFFCKKICQPTSTINATTRRPQPPNKYRDREARSHCVQPICRECARSVSSTSSTSNNIGLDFYKNTSSADMFAEWKHTFRKLLDGYKALMARQKDLEAIVRQVDPKNSTSLRSMMKNKELDRNHEIINKLMKELRGPIDLDDIFICICCNPPQTAGGRLLNDLHNGVKKNVNCLEGGVFIPPEEEIKLKKAEETKLNNNDDDDVDEEARLLGLKGKAGAKAEDSNEPNSNSNNTQRKCTSKELFLKLKNGPTKGQVMAALRSCGAKGKDAICKEPLKCLEHCFCEEENVLDLLKSACKTIECGCFELGEDDELVLSKPSRNVLSPEILETVLSLMADFNKSEKEIIINKLNLHAAKIMQDMHPAANEDVVTSVNMKATKVTLTISPKEARINNNSNKRRTTQVVYVSSTENPSSSSKVPTTPAAINPPPRNVAESEIDDALFQGPPNYDNSNDNKAIIEVADKSTQTMEYNGEDFASDNYWMFNFPRNPQEIKILSQSHTFRKTMRVRKIANKVYEKSPDPIQSPIDAKAV